MEEEKITISKKEYEKLVTYREAFMDYYNAISKIENIFTGIYYEVNEEDRKRIFIEEIQKIIPQSTDYDIIKKERYVELLKYEILYNDLKGTLSEFFNKIKNFK